MDWSFRMSACIILLVASREKLSFPLDFGWTFRRVVGESVDILTVSDSATHTLQYGTLWSPSVDRKLTPDGVHLASDAKPASLKAKISTTFPLHDRLGDMLLEDQTLSIISRRRFGWRLLDLCQLSLYIGDGSDGRAQADCCVSDGTWSAYFYNSKLFWLIQYDLILCLMNCSASSTKSTRVIKVWTPKYIQPKGIHKFQLQQGQWLEIVSRLSVWLCNDVICGWSL